MVDIVLLQAISIAIASAGVLIAAIYYIANLRHNMKAREMEIARLTIADYISEEGMQRWAVMMNMQWKDFEDFLKKYSDLNPEMFSKWTAQFFAWEMMGILLKNKVVRAEEMHDLGGYSAIIAWEKFKDIIQRLREVAWGQDFLRNAEWFAQEMRKVKMKKDASFKASWRPIEGRRN